MYNKLFTKILDSSIWLEADHTRLVWITFLAVMDQDGVVSLSGVGNVANRARVTEDQAANAILCLESPDHKNPDQDNEGRRIERIPGVGWFVLNSEKYRDIVKAEDVRAANRERKRRSRAMRHADVTDGHEKVTLSEAEADTNTEEREEKNIVENSKKIVADIFEFWQITCGHTTAHLTIEREKKIKARIAAGYTPDQIKEAIRGCKTSPHHQGQNDQSKIYDDIELICRSDTQLEKFIGYTRVPEKTNGTTRTSNGKPSNSAVIDEWAELARR